MSAPVWDLMDDAQPVLAPCVPVNPAQNDAARVPHAVGPRARGPYLRTRPEQKPGIPRPLGDCEGGRYWDRTSDLCRAPAEIVMRVSLITSSALHYGRTYQKHLLPDSGEKGRPRDEPGRIEYTGSTRSGPPHG